ncbi:type II secretion system secretin GspD [Terasakiispira papahanaumokuakeensis]|uniref:type II secretion system secretin GspD n=1 Tax=Terasakiispira papahanaumokuakeensis TaxID=197479 RepID=UPI000B0497ED|nr:type II secretion system secretin GspD [Terasakiispira papahanaumokuakeensis]
MKAILSSLVLACGISISGVSIFWTSMAWAETTGVEAAEAEAATDKTAEPNAEQRYTLDFNQVEIPEFVHSVGRITHKRFIIDPRVRGQITLKSQRRLTAEELYRVFQNTLQVNGFATVALPDGSLKVVPDQIARTQPLPVGDQAHNQGQVIATRVIETRYLEAGQLAALLQPLVDTRVGTLTPYPDSHLLIMTDWQDNLDRLSRLAQLIDRHREPQVDILPLAHANAKNMTETLTQLLSRQGRFNVQLVADERTNTLVVLGSDNGRARVKSLVTALDTPQRQDTNTRVIYLSHADASEVLDVLHNLQSGDNSDASLGASISSGAARNSDDPQDTAPATSSGFQRDGVSLAVHPGTNALILTGPGADLDRYQSIIKQLDIRRAQVAVEAIIAEISESRARQLGVQWLFADTSGKGTIPVGGINMPTSGQPGIAQIAAAAANKDNSALGSLLGKLNGLTAGVGRISDSGISFAMLLNALRSDTETNLLSTPSLTTLDNAEAHILVGQEVPFVTGSTTVNNANPYQTIERQNVGVSLNIKPTISADNTIRMEITQEVSSIADNVTASDVVTNKREIETTVLAQDGGIIVLGGLMSDNSSRAQQKVPILGDIPLIGSLFRYTDNSRDKQNLMVFIRARVLRDAESLDQATGEKYRYMRAQQLLSGIEGSYVLPEWSAQQSVDWQSLYPNARQRLGSLAP